MPASTAEVVVRPIPEPRVCRRIYRFNVQVKVYFALE